MLRIMLPFACALAVGACSNVSSNRIVSSSVGQHGLVYYMPKRDFIVTIEVEKPDKSIERIKAITLDVTDAYPDLEHAFVLKHHNSAINTHTSHYRVTTSGLLDGAASSDVKSNFGAAGDALGGLIGTITTKTVSVTDTTPKAPCTAGTHIFTGEREEISKLGPCGLTLTITPLGHEADDAQAMAQKNLAVGSAEGIYYRQALPYRMQLSGVFGNQHVDKARIVFNPTGAPIQSLEVASGLFADSQSTWNFDNGSPKESKVVTNGEVVGVLVLPAKVIGAYFKAVGEVFSAFSATDSAEAKALGARTTLEMAKLKSEACIKAIEAKDEDLIKDLECK
ncbi:hypothetical protein [Denitromonas iodatirespirans]|uniref:Lipoprotein n=1 Tax=Denitromonas iodatirespirans TaxID=2795389 RepID=A0A944DFW5_DENI1|nr:hypothetical protein [Denitromonas iodatirespirans]MBT0964231.1 hypothetical protein [Denitromonas iodatirespirans]